MKSNFILFSIGLLVIAACSSGNYSSPEKKTPTIKITQTDDPEKEYGTQARGTLSASQIYASMAKLTNVPLNTPVNRSEQNGGTQTIEAYFNEQRAALPAFNQAKTLSPAHFNAIINLADRFCSALTDRIDIRSNFFDETDFKTLETVDTPTALFGNALLKRAWAEFFLKKFWSLTNERLAEHGEDVADLSKLVDDLMPGVDVNSSNDSRKIMKSICAAVLAAAPINLN